MKHLFGAMLAIVLLVVAAPFATAQVVYHHAGGGTSTWTPPTNSAVVVATPAGTSPADPTGTATLRGEIASARPPSSGDYQVDRGNNRSDLEWGQLALQRERERARVELERERQAQWAAREAMEYDLRRREQERRNIESWSRVIGDQLNDKARRNDLKARREQERRRDAQRATEQALARSERILRSVSWR